MKRAELDRMSTDDLWSLHVEVTQLLHEKLQVEKLARDCRACETGMDAVVQQVRQSPHAWLSTSSFVSSIPPS